MREFKWYADNKIPLNNQPPEGFPFIGGKQDDITVTLAQVFRDNRGDDDPRKTLAERDTFYPD